ncbi:MAG: hypothetical protein K2I91_02225 [Muribaculaceae bacterium]|nr:hypothetical protein [Muribaculaceae bacterium]
MKPYSRREIRGLLLLAIVCLLCVGLGLMSRRGWFNSRRPETHQSTRSIAPEVSDSLTGVSAGTRKASAKSSDSKKKRENRQKSLRKKRNDRRLHAEKQSPVRDVLNDTIDDY